MSTDSTAVDGYTVGAHGVTFHPWWRGSAHRSALHDEPWITEPDATASHAADPALAPPARMLRVEVVADDQPGVILGVVFVAVEPTGEASHDAAHAILRAAELLGQRLAHVEPASEYPSGGRADA